MTQKVVELENELPVRQSWGAAKPLSYLVAFALGFYGLSSAWTNGYKASEKWLSEKAYSYVEKDLARREFEVDPKGKLKSGKDASRQDLAAALGVIARKLDQERFKVSLAIDSLNGGEDEKSK